MRTFVPDRPATRDVGIPWDTLDGSAYPDLLVARARAGWTENAFNEWCTREAMRQLHRWLVEIEAPDRFVGQVARSIAEEGLHVELCASVAERLGGVADRWYDEEDLHPRLEREPEPMVAVAEAAVRICCVGEGFSFPMLSGALRTAGHPVTRRVLARIVHDERSHGPLGYEILDWASPWLEESDRALIGLSATATLRTYAPLWTSLTSRVVDGRTSEGFRVEDVHALGWMLSEDYARLARRVIVDAVQAPLARRGIQVELP